MKYVKVCTVRLRIAAGNLLRLVEEHDGYLPICLDPTKAGVELLANMLPAAAQLTGTVTSVELTHAYPYVLLADITVWVDYGESADDNGVPSEWLARPLTADVRQMIMAAAAKRASIEGGLRLHPLESRTEQ